MELALIGYSIADIVKMTSMECCISKPTFPDSLLLYRFIAEYKHMRFGGVFVVELWHLSWIIPSFFLIFTSVYILLKK